jgi:hypothetical protein
VLVLVIVAAVLAATFGSTDHSTSKALTILLKALGLGAAAFFHSNFFFWVDNNQRFSNNYWNYGSNSRQLNFFFG